MYVYQQQVGEIRKYVGISGQRANQFFGQLSGLELTVVDGFISEENMRPRTISEVLGVSQGYVLITLKHTYDKLQKIKERSDAKTPVGYELRPKYMTQVYEIRDLLSQQQTGLSPELLIQCLPKGQRRVTEAFYQDTEFLRLGEMSKSLGSHPSQVYVTLCRAQNNLKRLVDLFTKHHVTEESVRAAINLGMKMI